MSTARAHAARWPMDSIVAGGVPPSGTAGHVMRRASKATIVCTWSAPSRRAPSHPAWTLVFGNPAAGEQLLAHERAAAIDIPLRLAVIGTGPGTSAIVIRPMSSLLAPPLAE